MPEDFSRLRMLVKRLVHTEFQEQWQFRLEIEGEPADFDLYVKDISYGPSDVKTEEDECGSISMTWPTGINPVKISATVRDNVDQRVSRFFDAWCRKAAHPDGTVGLPYGADGYVRKVKKYIVTDDGEQLEGVWEMFAVTRGDISQSRDTLSEFLEFPVVMVQLSTAPPVPAING